MVIEIWLQDIDMAGAHKAPIDTARYRYLSFRMCSSVNDLLIIFWHKNSTFAAGSFGSTRFKPASAGCFTYAFDLGGEHYGEAWGSAPMQSIAIKPGNTAGVTIKLDYARLSSTPIPDASQIMVTWTTASDKADLYFSTQRTGTDATLIAKGLTGARYPWIVPHLAPAPYYLFIRTGIDQSPLCHSPFSRLAVAQWSFKRFSDEARGK